MARGLYLPIIGDPRQFISALRQGRLAAQDFGVSVSKNGVAAADGMKMAGAAAGQLSADMGKVAVAAERSVKVQIAAEARREARLRQEIVLFNQMAAAAKRGSQEQILASNLSSRAQAQLAGSLGVSAKESEHLRRSSGSMNREIGRDVRGAVAGSGAFRALGRSLAFASGGFLVFASGAGLIRGSIDATRDWVKTQRSLRAQFAASGQDLGLYNAQIDQTVNKVSRLGGFTRQELTRGFIVAFRQVGNVTNALRLMADAAAAARGTGRPLATITLGLTKAFGGQASALRRLGIIVPEHAKGLRVLQFVEGKFAGQLKANTTNAERFHSSLVNMQEAVGGALLPAVNRLQGRLAAWLSKTKNQEAVTRTLTGIVGGLAAVLGPTAKAIGGVASALGGWKNAIIVVSGIWLGLKVKAVGAAIAIQVANVRAAVASAAAWVSSSRTAALTLEEQYAEMETGVATVAVANTAAAAEVSAAWKAALISTGWGAIAVAAGIAAAYIITHWKQVKTFFSNLGREIVNSFKYAWYLLEKGGLKTALAIVEPFSHLPSFLGGWARKAKDAMQHQLAQLHPPNMDWSRRARAQGETTGKAWRKGFLGTIGNLIAKAIGDVGAAVKAAAPQLRRTVENRGPAAIKDFQKWLDKQFGLAAAKASATRATADDLRVAREEERAIRKAIKQRRLHGDELVAAYQELGTLNGQLATNVKGVGSAAKEAAQKAKEARDALRQAVSQAVDQIGQLFAGPILAPTQQQIEAQLGVKPPTVGTLTQDVTAQNAATRAWLRDIKKLIKEGAPKQLIQELLAAGPEQAAYVHQLATASKAQLRKFFKAYEERLKLGYRIATVHMNARNVDLVARDITIKGSGRVTHSGAAGGGQTHGGGSRDGGGGAGRAVRRAAIDIRDATIHVRNLMVRAAAARAPSLGRLTLTARRVDLHANTVHLAGLSASVIGDSSSAAPIILKLDSDVVAKGTLPAQQRRARRQVAQVRGRRGGEILALG